jgi:predicted AlkP superfamily pyrophosphatase or phosphodiesterase
MKRFSIPFSWRRAGAFRVACVIGMSAACGKAFGGSVEHVIHISVDGLRPDAITALGPTNLPNFYRFRTEGA